MTDFVIHKEHVGEILWRNNHYLLFLNQFGGPQLMPIFGNTVIGSTKDGLISLQKEISKIRTKRDLAVAIAEERARKKILAMYDPYNKQIHDIIKKYRQQNKPK